MMRIKSSFMVEGLVWTAAVMILFCGPLAMAGEEPLPSIVYILADDMGYGDPGCLNADSKIPMPNMNRLGAEGMIFTDAHSGSAVCTPTRYGILTGRYSWRTRLQAGVLWGWSAPLLDRSRMTVASLLKEHGYATACIGKWHLGWVWQTTNGKPVADRGREEGSNVDYSLPILRGPLDAGFDYYFGIPASLDMTPHLYVENDRVLAAPTEWSEGAKEHAFHRAGPCAPGFKHDEVLPRCTQKAVDFIDRLAASRPKDPFFLYFPLSAPHAPIVPSKEFEGKTGLGPYADFVHQCDWTVGRIMEALEKHGMADNTLFIVTSDNGTSTRADFKHLASLGHDPSYIFRGHKADIFEGGHRLPFIARWPAQVRAGAVCDDTICHTDLLATAADLVGATLPDDAGEDSCSILPDLLGTAAGPVREATVHHSSAGYFSIRQGKWKLEFCPGSGGWSQPKGRKAVMRGLPMIQLYDLEADVGEENNVQDRYPDVVHRLTCLLESYVEKGRSTPGAPQENDAAPDIWKAMKLRRDNYTPSRVKHLAENKTIAAVISKDFFRYSDRGITVLADGIRATPDYDNGDWFGVEGEDLEVVIDLGEACEIQQVGVGFLEDQEVWIFHPEWVEFSLSVDGQAFGDPKRCARPALKSHSSKKVKDWTQSFDGTQARYVKVNVKNTGICPEWHRGSGGKAWIFMDEIYVH